MTAADWIKKRRELEQAAIEGPWSAGTVEGVDYGAVMGPPHDEGPYTFIPVLVNDLSHYDGTAEWIADARTSLPRALDALERVLELAANQDAVYDSDLIDAIESALGGDSDE